MKDYRALNELGNVLTSLTKERRNKQICKGINRKKQLRYLHIMDCGEKQYCSFQIQYTIILDLNDSWYVIFSI